MTQPSRVLLKLSGEALSHEDSSRILQAGFMESLAPAVEAALGKGVQIAMVIGGGNIIRGSLIAQLGMDRVKGDFMGMLATAINSLAMGAVLEKAGIPVRIFSAVAGGSVLEPYSPTRAMEALSEGRVAILAGGTGNPFFTTDTAAALRAVELRCDGVLKATKVRGVYSADPVKHPDAEFFAELTFDDVIRRNLKVMDLTAFALCRENRVQIRVFNLYEEGNLARALLGEAIGTLVHL